MQTLQALHQELDIADAARGQLDIQSSVRPLGGQFLADALARLGDRFHGPEIQRARIDQRLDEFQQFAAQGQISSAHPRFDQHLLFPIARALLVVALGAGERNADFAQAAVRAANADPRGSRSHPPCMSKAVRCTGWLPS
jgi:hypothetical protein